MTEVGRFPNSGYLRECRNPQVKEAKNPHPPGKER